MKLAVENPGLGSLVTYETEDGTKHRGIMLTRKWRALDTLPVEIEATDLAIELLTSQNAELRSSKELAKTGVSLRQSPRSIGNFQIELPSPHSRRYGNIHTDPVIAKIARMAQAQKNGTSIKVDIDKDTARQALNALQAQGVRLFCSGRHREWIAEKTKAAASVQEPVVTAGFAA
jgi:hypothetical protein